jgi:hypothetical protein
MSDPGLLVHVHIPRCSGTSVAHWLRLALLRDRISGFGLFYPDFVFENEAQYTRAGCADPRLTAISTHNVRSFPKTISGREAHYFTILREPLAHIVSIARYVREQRSAFDVPSHVSDETRDIADWLLHRPLNAPFRENTQTNHLALYTWCESTSGRCKAENYGNWAGADERAYREQRLDVAKAVLRSFLCVGLVEDLNSSLARLKRRCAVLGIELLPPEEAPHVNSTMRPPDHLAWIHSGDPVGVRMRDSIRVDLELYAFAREMLESGEMTTNA